MGMKTLFLLLLSAVALQAQQFIMPLLPVPPGDATKFLNGTMQWSTPSGGGGGVTGTLINTTATTAGQLVKFTDTSKTNTAPVVATDIVTFGGSVTPPYTITQSSTNVAASFSDGSLQLMTANADVNLWVTNFVAGASTLIDIGAGGSDRTLTFDSSWVWMSAKPTTLTSGKIMWISLLSTTTAAGGVRASAVQSFP